jgi:hypothetical protein
MDDTGAVVLCTENLEFCSHTRLTKLSLNLKWNWVLLSGNKFGRNVGTILYLLCIFLRQISVSFMMHLDFRSIMYLGRDQLLNCSMPGFHVHSIT